MLHTQQGSKTPALQPNTMMFGPQLIVATKRGYVFFFNVGLIFIGHNLHSHQNMD